MSHEYNKNPAAVDALNPEQYHVTQENGTERPFSGGRVDDAPLRVIAMEPPVGSKRR